MIEEQNDTSENKETINDGEFASGINPNYKTYKIQVDPNMIIDKYAEHNCEVYVSSHTVETGNSSDDLPTDTIEYTVKRTAGNGLFSYTVPITEAFVYYGDAYGWASAVSGVKEDNSGKADLSGLKEKFF